jgi:hypothetical protein
MPAPTVRPEFESIKTDAFSFSPHGFEETMRRMGQSLANFNPSRTRVSFGPEWEARIARVDAAIREYLEESHVS